jgi:Na+/glutamate symporter
MIQGIIIGVLIIAATVYLIRMMLRSYRANATCESGCGKCAVTDKTPISVSK